MFVLVHFGSNTIFYSKNRRNYWNICNERYLTTSKCTFLVIFEENPSHENENIYVRKEKLSITLVQFILLYTVDTTWITCFHDRICLLSNYSQYMIIKHLFHLVMYCHLIETIENVEVKIIVLNLKIVGLRDINININV